MKTFLVSALFVVLLLGLAGGLAAAIVAAEQSGSYRVELIHEGKPVRSWVSRGRVHEDSGTFRSLRSWTFTDASTGQSVTISGGVVVVTRME